MAGPQVTGGSSGIESWITSHEVAIMGVAGSAGAIVASTSAFGTDLSGEVVPFAVLVGTIAHIVQRAVQAFTASAQAG